VSCWALVTPGLRKERVGALLAVKAGCLSVLLQVDIDLAHKSPQAVYS